MSLIATPKLAELFADSDKIALLPSETVPALRGELARLDSLLLARLLTGSDGTPESGPDGDRGSIPVQAELIDCAELAKRWKLPLSWVRDSVRNRSGDPIPCVRLGRYVRFQWGAPELQEWFERRKNRRNDKSDGKNRFTKNPSSVYQ